jgi:transcriptional regulator with XRE-family HTH domain
VEYRLYRHNSNIRSELENRQTMLNGTYVKKWRQARNLSARELGQALGYRGRENVAKIEAGLLPLTPKFARRFTAYKNHVQAREYRERKIESRYALPCRIKILARPRRCAICREWFIFPNAIDRVCTDRKCRRVFRARQAKTGTQ